MSNLVIATTYESWQQVKNLLPIDPKLPIVKPRSAEDTIARFIGSGSTTENRAIYL